MARRVAICAVEQTKFESNLWHKRFQDMVFDVVREALGSARMSRECLDTVVSASSDFLDGRTISNVFLSMANGAFLKDESKVEEDGAMAMLYALMRILAGTQAMTVYAGEEFMVFFDARRGKVTIKRLVPVR